MLAFDWRYTLAESDLPKVRGSTQLAGVAVGFPFLDDALLDFSLRLPADYKLKGLKLRWFFKEALRGFLPDEIIAKKKQGFGLPFGVWANRHDGAAGSLAADSLHSLAARGIVRPEFIARAAGAAPAGAPGLLRRDGLDPDDAGAVAAQPCAGLPLAGLNAPAEPVGCRPAPPGNAAGRRSRIDQ